MSPFFSIFSVEFDFIDDLYSPEEQAEIEAQWEEGGCGWLYDGEHNLQVEDHAILIYGPVNIELIDDDGNVLEEGIEAKEYVTSPTAWPFVKAPKESV